jgi:hypothetical protein
MRGILPPYLDDGLLVYFGYPLAHEDDAQRAVRAGLGMVEVPQRVASRLFPRLPPTSPLASLSSSVL